MTHLWITEFAHHNILPPIRAQAVAITPSLIGFALKEETRWIRLYAESACLIFFRKDPILYLPEGGGDSFEVNRDASTGMAVQAI